MHKSLAALLLLTMLVAPARAEDARSRIAKAAGRVASIQADFVQEKHLSMFTEVLSSTGRFAYERPDKLRWELLAPAKSGFVLRGASGERWHEMTGKKEPFSVDRDPVMKAVSEQLLGWAAADFARLEKEYEISVLSEVPARFRLVPRSKALKDQLQAVEVSFSTDDAYVEEVVVREKSGDFTKLLFKGVKLNSPIPAGTF